MKEPEDIVRAARHVVVQDYPDEELPAALTRAGLEVTIYGGPTEADVAASELHDGEVVHRMTGRYPDHADILSVYRPATELDAILAEARRLGVGTIWRQPPVGATADPDGSRWRERVEAAGLTYLDAPPIDEVARSLHS